MKNPRPILLNIIAMLLAFPLINIQAATNVFFDVNGSTTNAGIVNGTTYTWESSDWSTAAGGNVATTAWTEGWFPEFSAGSDGGTASYTVNAGSPHTVPGMLERNSSGTVTLTGSTLTIAPAGGQGFLVGPGNLVINNVLTGSGGVVPECNSGCGDLTLNGNNTYTGGFFMGGANIVFIGNANALGTGSLFLNGVINGAFGNDGIMDFLGNFTIPNNVNMGSGLYSAGKASQAQFIFDDTSAHNMTFSGNWTTGTSNSTILQFGNQGTNQTFTISGNIGGNNGFTNYGTGTLILTGNNTFGGALNLTSAGVIVVGGSGVLKSTLNVTNSGTFNYSSSSAQTLSGVVAGAGTLIQSGSGTLTLSGNNTYTGPTTINAGSTLTIASGGKLGGGTYAAAITDNGTLTYNSTAAQTLSGIISGSGTITEAGTGGLTLSGANTYSGQTVISAGLLAISADGNLGTAPATPTNDWIEINSGTNNNYGLRVTANMTINANRGILLGSTGGQIQVAQNDTLTYNGVISGSGGFESGTAPGTGLGTLVLGGANTYTGPTLIAAGTIKLNTAGALPSGTPLVIGSDTGAGATLDLNGFTQTIGPLSSSTGIGGAGTKTPTLKLSAPLTINETNSTTFAGNIANSGGSLTLQGGSTLTLTGSNNYSGPTILTYGILALGANGSISNTASISIAPGQTLDVSAIPAFNLSSSTALSATGTLAPAVINGANGGSVNLGSQPITLNFDGTHPVLSVPQGTLVLNGNPFTINGTPLAAGSYTIIQQANGAVSVSGTSVVTGTTIAAGTTGYISASGGNVNLVIVPNPSFSNLTVPSSISYGASPVALSGTLSAPGPIYPAMGETVTVTINGNAQTTTINDSTGDFSINYNSATLPVTSSPFTITYSYAGDTSLGVGSDNSTSISVTPASLTVSAANQSKTYGQAVVTGAGSTSFTSSGLQNGESIGSVTIAVSGGGAAAAAPVSGSPYTITASAAAGGSFNPANYSISYNTGLLTVNPASLTVAANSFSRAYGATNPVFTVTYTNFANGETLGTSDVTGSPVLTTSGDTNSDVGGYVVTNAIGTLASSNYSFSLVNGLLTVTNALSTNVVTAGPNPALPATAVVFSANLSTIAPSLAVPTNVVQFLIDGTNYGSIYPSNGVASITNASLSHGYHTIEADYDGDTNSLGETNIVGSTNMVSELINTPPVAGPATYSRSANTALNINVSDLLTNATDADGDVLTLLSVSSVSTNGATIAINSGVVTYTPPATNGNVTDVFTYVVEDSYGATNASMVTITVATASPTFSNLGAPSSTYGSAAVTLSGTLSSGSTYPASGEAVSATIGGHTVAGSVIDNAGDFTIVYNDPSLAAEAAGSYPITYSYGGDSSLSSATDSSSSLTINPAPLIVTASGQSKTYGQTVTFGSGSTNFANSGLQKGETIGSVTLAVSGNGGASSAPVSGSPYTVTPSAATGGTFNPANYSISYNNGLLTVGPASLTVAADNLSRPYGATNPVFTVTYTNFVNGETLATSDVQGAPALVTAADTNSDVGAYVITNTIGTLTSSNYVFALVNGSLNVTNALSTTVLTPSANPAPTGADVFFHATISAVAPSTATPTNLVEYFVDGTNYAAFFTNADFGITLSHGYHTVLAHYVGDTNALGETNIASSVATVTELINTPPVAGPATYSRLANATLQINVSDLLTNASDADSDAITLVSVSSASTNGATIVTNSGVITYTPPSTNGNVTDVFSYTVADSFGATNTGSVSVTVLSEANGPAVNITGVAALANGAIQLNFTGGANYYYLIEGATDLNPPVAWTILATNQAGTNGMFQFTDGAATNYPMRFYRTAVPPGY